jgi:hypothetical protein
MSSSSQNLSLGAAVDFQIDPNIPQSSKDSVEQINDATKAQVALINATTKTGGRRRRRQKSLSYKGGDIVVAPLPLGTDTANAQANNVAAATLFANAVSSSKYDNAVVKVGGKGRRRTRRLSKKRTRRRRTSARRSAKYRKMMKVKKSRRTRRR